MKQMIIFVAVLALAVMAGSAFGQPEGRHLRVDPEDLEVEFGYGLDRRADHAFEVELYSIGRETVTVRAVLIRRLDRDYLSASIQGGDINDGFDIEPEQSVIVTLWYHAPDADHFFGNIDDLGTEIRAVSNADNMGQFNMHVTGGIIDPNEPRIRFLGQLDTQNYTRDVAISGDYAYVVGGELSIISVTDPENPEEVEHCYTRGRAQGVTVSGDYAYIADGERGLRIIDVSDPEDPVEDVYVYCNTPGNAYNVFVSGDYAYVADWETGLRVISVADPENPEEVGFIDTPGNAWDVTVSGEYAYVAGGHYGGLRIISIVDPEEPEEVGYYDTEGWACGVTIEGNIVYIADRYDGLRIISVVDPENPEEIGYYYTEGLAHEVSVCGDYAYVAVGEPGLCVINISDPENPEEVDSYDSDGSAIGVFVCYGIAYVADNDGGLLILDVSDFAPQPAIAVEPDRLGFGEVFVDEDSELTITISNVGIANLTVSEISVDGDYFSTDFDEEAVIEPQDTLAVTVIFAPMETGDFEGTLTINSDDPDNGEIIVTLAGAGIEPQPAIAVEPDSLDFGEVNVDEDSELSLAISNEGNANLTVSDILVEGDQFSTDFDTLLVLEPDSSQDVTVTFTPDAIDNFEGTLTIISDDPVNDSLTVTLIGIGPDAVDD
ncbi:MAG: choice-of-anchor D domain-containing protein, partial [Candidatus Electryoneaceae bacterium]|nr:choice-of-anchor D domain-containing protein [Candidatus Electryoneaceae bacterium]